MLSKSTMADNDEKLDQFTNFHKKKHEDLDENLQILGAQNQTWKLLKWM